MNAPEVAQIVENIVSSKKYCDLYPKTVERVVREMIEKFGLLEAEKRTKQELHRIWGSFYGSRPRFDRVLEKFGKALHSIGGSNQVSKFGIQSKTHNPLYPPQPLRGETDQTIRELLLPILSLHASTKERIPILPEFYQKIFSITGIPSSIVEYASGLNPLTYFWMNLPERTSYTAFDIDLAQNEFLNHILTELEVQHQVRVLAGDILIDSVPAVDVIFILKLLPLLEEQEKGSALRILRSLTSGYVVVSFSTASISGKRKGMKEFYERQFLEMIRNEPWQVKRLSFPSELVFVIKK